MITHYGATASDVSRTGGHEFDGKGCESKDECECNVNHIVGKHSDIFAGGHQNDVCNLNDDVEYQNRLRTTNEQNVD